MTNHGFDQKREQEEQLGNEWTFGATSPICIAEGIPEDQRAKYLPVGEVQRCQEDTMDCATRGPVNILECKFDYLISKQLLSLENEYWLRENGYIDDGVKFSDAFVSINAGTTRQGNSMKAPIDAIKKYGLIPKKMCPLLTDMTFDDYMNPKRITQEMRDLGAEFLRRFVINYEKVYEKDFETLLKKDLLNVAGYAWPQPVNGEYPRTERDPNHVFVAYRTPKYNIFDNYLDPVDGDFTKKLASDYDFMGYGYRLLINKTTPEKSIWDLILNYLKELFR